MRFIFSFLFSIAHRLASIIIGAHVELTRNLVARHPDADRPHEVKRG